jgi:hypothetical protein
VHEERERERAQSVPAAAARRLDARHARRGALQLGEGGARAIVCLLPHLPHALGSRVQALERVALVAEGGELGRVHLARLGPEDDEHLILRGGERVALVDVRVETLLRGGERDLVLLVGTVAETITIKTAFSAVSERTRAALSAAARAAVSAARFFAAAARATASRLASAAAAAAAAAAALDFAARSTAPAAFAAAAARSSRRRELSAARSFLPIVRVCKSASPSIQR